MRDTSVSGDPARGAHSQLPGVDEAHNSYAHVQGFSWDPSGSGRLTFGSQAYTCVDQGRQMQPPTISVWDTASQDAPLKLAEGLFPVWLK